MNKRRGIRICSNPDASSCMELYYSAHARQNSSSFCLVLSGFFSGLTRLVVTLTVLSRPTKCRMRSIILSALPEAEQAQMTTSLPEKDSLFRKVSIAGGQVPAHTGEAMTIVS